jgi:nucleoid-associated protein YgaU
MRKKEEHRHMEMERRTVMEAQLPSQTPSHFWFEWYHVEEGDTLSEIAEWWFGRSGERWWRRIWLTNRRTIGEDPNRIRPGQWLKLPFGEFRYRIVQGDTLYQLAEWVYGDGNAWPRIWNRNPWIENPNELQPGRWIWIYHPVAL